MILLLISNCKALKNSGMLSTGDWPDFDRISAQVSKAAIPLENYFGICI